MIAAAPAILVARQLAALRRHQWSTLDAVSFIGTALPPGALRSLCEQSVLAMRGGRAPAQWTSPLEQLLSRGEAATPETLECLAESLEAREQAQSGLTAAVGMARLLVVGPLLIGALFGWGVLPNLEPLGFDEASLPGLTQLSIAVLDALSFLGVPLAAAGWFVVPRLLRRMAPGARQFEVAAQLLELAATDPAAPRRLQLAGAELRFFSWRESKAGAARAARDTAHQLLREGRVKVRTFEHFAPIVVVIAGAAIFSSLLVPLLLPLFSLAGAIK